MDLSLRVVRYFVTVAETGHFGQAAERLFISQPALSQQIKRFEAQFGCQLLERSRSGVSLTPAGEVFLDEARALLAAGEAAVARTLRATEQGELIIAFVAGTPHDLTAKLLQAAESMQSELALNLVRIDWASPFARLRSGAVDAAILHLPCEEPNIDYQPIHHEARVAVLPADHHLAGRKKISINDLDPEPVLDSNFNREFWLVIPRPSSCEPCVVQPAPDSAEQLMDLVAQRRGIAITAQTVSELYQRPDVVAVPIFDIDQVQLGLAWPAEHPAPAVPRLADALAIDGSHESGGQDSQPRRL
ncbi:LysR family transcriptional regulator [Candidatus Poriferisocius sp.]|uniref:LysR family transcriptional regulator n=1 Tax=Candidatus Poriferisocius sp. TaxID=3101276 RepID=UPI003B0179F5